MQITLFHGSRTIVQKPFPGGGNPRNDYGSGFYCTESIELAREWASSDNGDGFVNEYTIDTEGLSTLNLGDKPFHILNWLAVLLENRTFDLKAPLPAQAKKYILDNFLPDYKHSDIIAGYRADDSYFSFSRAFLDNSISLTQLSRAMKLGKLGEQIVLKSERAFDRIQFRQAFPVSSSEYYPRKMARDRLAREQYFNMLKESHDNSALYAIDMIRQNWKNDDTRLF